MLETAADKDREEAITRDICRAWSCKAGSLGRYSRVDRYLYNGDKLRCAIEIKARANRDSNTFPTVLLNLDKFMNLAYLEALTRLPAYYFVLFKDGLYYVDVRQVRNCPIVVRGRKDRNLQNDVEPCYEIPITEFRRMK